MKADKKIVIPVVAGVLIAAIALYFIFGGLNGDSQNSNLFIGDSPIIGDPDAPVTIYEFSDFSCPFCAAAEGKNAYLMGVLESEYPGWEAPMPLVKKNYVETGKAKIVFKYFPGHGAAKAAHAVAFGLYEQNPDLFWKFAEVAFANQQNLNDITLMKSWAKNLGGDDKALAEYLDSGKYETQLAEDEEMGKNNGIKGTPTFIINGQKISGAQSYSAFETILEN